jgi:hypothetical protein
MRRLLLSLGVVLAGLPLVAVGQPATAQTGGVEVQRVLASGSEGFNLSTVDTLLARGDREASSGALAEAVKSYDKARNAARSLLSFYRDLGGAFRGLDARIPRDMDQKGREAIEKLSQANLRLAAVYRRQNQAEVAVPLLVEVVKLMTPASPDGRKAYQQLLEIGFVSTPYTPTAAN